MYFKKMGFKRFLCLGMTFAMIATAAPLQQSVMDVRAEVAAQSDEAAKVTLESVRAEAAASYAGDEKMGFDIDFSPKAVTSGINYSADTADRHYMEVFNNLRTSTDDQTVIIRFKTSQNKGLLFGVGGEETNNGKNMIFGLKNGGFRTLLRGENANGVGAVGYRGDMSTGNLADGAYHTVAVSFLPSMGRVGGNVHIVVDGGSDLYPANWGNTFAAGFNCQKSETYTKFEIAGGTYAYDDPCDGATFNGEIDFLTVINKAYSVQDLQNITKGDRNYTNFSEMFASGTSNTWLFTGGTEGVADFATSRTTRNWVGLFESDFRESGTFVERGRFVFNTSKRGADIAQILAEYDTRVSTFGTKVVGVMIGAADYQRGEAGIAAFKETLQALIGRITEENKLPLILTPYPSLNAEDMENITAYTAAIQEVAGTRIKVVDLSGLATANNFNSDGNLTAAGHQAIANAIKAGLGRSERTNYAFDKPLDGSYTMAKTTEAGALAQVASVTIGESSINVRVDADSISGETAQLEYVLTSSAGEKISGIIASGETEFTVDGLQEGAIYTLNVYDASRGNVKESYKPVRVTMVEGAKAVNLEYEDGNVSANENIQALIKGDKPATWLFMGDSITHGVRTLGYDNVPQMFAKYIDELGRYDDIVLNTAVTNATIATTLDQIEPRLKRYMPDAVFIMLGTNDIAPIAENTVTNGVASASQISPTQYKERYETLVEEIYKLNPKASIVLRVPCGMVVDSNHSRYKEMFAEIYNVKSELEDKYVDIDITVVNHWEEWTYYMENVRNDSIMKTGDYRWLTYGWTNDNLHPNGRGNISMFQQIIKEIGIYDNTSELANYAYDLNEWTDDSDISAPVVQQGSRASFLMNHVSGYANGLKNVTLTLMDGEKSISKTEDYSANETITITGLDDTKTYTAKVTGKDSTNSKEVTFAATLTKRDASSEASAEEKQELTDKLEEAKKFDTSSYPQEISGAYADAIAELEKMDTEGMTLGELEAALNQVRLAMANAQIAIDEYDTAKDALVKAAKASKEAYLDKEADYGQLAGWNNYEWAYADAESIDQSTPLSDLKTFLSNLQAAEGVLDKQKEEADKNVGGGDNNDDNNGNNNGDNNGNNNGGNNNNGDNNSNDGDKDQPKPLEQGKTYYVGDYGYQITDLSAQTVTLAEIKSEALTKLEAKNEVTLEDNKNYQVTAIATGLFKNYKNKAKVTDVTIHVNITDIEAQAFLDYKKLKSVTLNSTQLKTIGKKAFFGCTKLKKITIKSEVLKTVKQQAFKNTAKKLTIIVPKKKWKAYSSKVLKNKGQSKQTKIKKGK